MASTSRQRFGHHLHIEACSGGGGPETENLEEDEALDVKSDIEGWSQNSKLQLQWASLSDHYGNTLRGTRPRPNPPVFVERALAEVMAIARSQVDHFKLVGERH